MAGITVVSTSTTMLANSTFLLNRLSFLSINRTCFHHSIYPFRISLTSSHNLPTPWITNAFSQPQAKPRSMQSVADGKTEEKSARNAVIVKKDKKTVGEPRYSKAARRYYNQRFGEKPQRLAKVLAAAGVASRRSSEELIFQGHVTVNGNVCDTPQTRVDPAKDTIYVKGNRLPKRLPPKVYLAVNKPKGYICSSGEKEFKSILCLCDDFLKSWDKENPGQPKPRLFTVGRLDVATTGLIIVTNDGDFAQRVSHPSSNLTKEYIATVNGDIHKKHLVAINQGTTIDGVHCIPEYVELMPRQPEVPRHRLRIVVSIMTLLSLINLQSTEIHTTCVTHLQEEAKEYYEKLTKNSCVSYFEERENITRAIDSQRSPFCKVFRRIVKRVVLVLGESSLLEREQV